MCFRRSLLAVLGAAVLVLSSCQALVAAYLINQLLNDQAPKKTWSGTVRDTTDNPVGGVTVQVRGRVEGDTNVATFSDVTDAAGYYSIKFRWNSNVMYSIQVTHEGVVLANIDYGTIQQSDRVSDIVIQGAVNVELSGVISGPDGLPLSGIVVVGASVAALEDTPTVLLTESGKTAYDTTNDAGVYQLSGAIARYGIVCAYHPDHGFAYAYGEDTGGNGSIALYLTMGAAGTYAVRAQVVDGTGTPLTPQVLAPGRQFRLRLQTPFNLSAAMDVAVGEHGLFPGLIGEPSDTHPGAVTLTVQATGANGISTSSVDAAGSTYDLRLLNVSDDDPATAMVQSVNPLALFQDSVVVVRVN
jgi:hypothetical protein